MFIAANYGATRQTDAYNMAINIISLLTAIVAAGVAAVIIPIYIQKKVQQTDEEARLFAGNLLCITSLFYVIISILGIVFAPGIVRVFAMNFSEETAALTVSLMRIMFTAAVGLNIVDFLSLISRANEKFIVPSLISLPLTIVIVLFTVLFSGNIGIYALVYAFIVYTFIQVIMLVISLRSVFKIKFMLNFTNGDFSNVFILCLPIFFNVAIREINVAINRILASGLPEGSISAINYANVLRNLPDGIMTFSLATVIFPLLSKYAAKNEFHDFKRLATKAISLVFITLLPVIAVSLFFGIDIVRLVYERGAFTPDNTILTSHIFTFAIISIGFSTGASVLSNAFYGAQDTKTPQIAMAVMVISNIALNLIFVRHMEAAGLVLASSIAFTVFFVLLLVLFRRKYGSFGGLSLLKDIGKYIAAAAGMVPVFLLSELLRDRLPLIVFLAIGAGASLAAYAGLLYLFKAGLFMEGVRRLRRNS
jgi:putative peptidoglycan lipid II flippase